MSQSILDHVASKHLKRVPELKPGYTVRVHQKIKEGDKVRTQVFEGLVIKIGSGSGINKTFTVRRIVENIGVEKLFPFHSMNIEKIEIVKRGKVRRSKLYYMRDRAGKSARLRDRALQDVVMIGPDELVEAELEEEVVPEENSEDTNKETVQDEPESNEEAEIEQEEATEAGTDESETEVKAD